MIPGGMRPGLAVMRHLWTLIKKEATSRFHNLVPILAQAQLSVEQEQRERKGKEREERVGEGATKGSREGRMVRGGEEMELRRKIQREGSDGCGGHCVRNGTECIFLSLVQQLQS